jgi:Protein of unknown function (DUF3050)
MDLGKISHSHPSVPAATPDPANALREAIAGARHQVLNHAIYDSVRTLDDVRCLMQHHVFAVWDFMCLAKRLQRDLTSLHVLWRPPASTGLARFINGIILAEESDTDADGFPMSHLEMYLAAMREVGARTLPFERFLRLVCAGARVRQALATIGAPAPVCAFVENTLACVEQGTTVEVLASFLFGREDLIPEMFSRFLPCWEGSRDAARFTHYVRRHVALDGEDHGPAAQRALVQLAGQDALAWRRATAAAKNALTARIALWDGVCAELRPAHLGAAPGGGTPGF